MANYNLLMVEEITGEDTEFIRNMVKAFIDEIPADLNAMIEAVDNENPTLTYQVTHKMKPNLQLFGLNLDAEIATLEGWESNQTKKEDIQSTTHHIEKTVVLAIDSLKKDFDL